MTKLIKASKEAVSLLRDIADSIIRGIGLTDGDAETARHVADRLGAAIEDDPNGNDDDITLTFD
jgi:hypothetical protein